MWARDLGGLLGRVTAPRQLSLDCFDTLLWRRTRAPVDVFFDMQHRPAFARLGLTGMLRARAEDQARRLAYARTGSREVSLADIYRAAVPTLSDEDVARLSEDEIAAEMDACFAFPAAVELLREAARRQLPVMIVSDTYLSRDQLHRLLTHCVPADALRAVQRIVCSSEHGVSKSGGLFKRILQRWAMAPSSILHVGDNEVSDVKAATREGLRAVHVVQVDEQAAARSRMQGVALTMMDAGVRSQRGMARPYHGVLASDAAPAGLASAVGYAALGPVMHAFADYVLSERETLQRNGRRVKMLFLMRDAHLPNLACSALAGADVGVPVRISRFTAYAASFRCRGDIESYLVEVMNPDYLEVMARQLLLPAPIAERVIARARQASDPAAEFTRQVLKPDTVEIVRAASTAFRAKLYRYLERQADVAPGDTVMFVDLGYRGTAQTLLEPVFRDEWGIDVVGRYLIAMRVPGWERSRAGLIDPSWCDDRVFGSIVSYISLLEKLCSSNDASVIDYREDGEPIVAAEMIDDDQRARVRDAQTEALRFVTDAGRFFARCGHPGASALRDAAFAELARMIFFPTSAELEFLASFKTDVNLGTKDTVPLYDVDAGVAAMRRHGMPFADAKVDRGRLTRPAAMHTSGVELSLSLLAYQRYGLELGLQDRGLRREAVRVLVIRGDQSGQQVLHAAPTHDGWFALHLPLMGGGTHTAIAFGERYRHVQIDSVQVVPLAELSSPDDPARARDVTADLVFDQMAHLGSGLYECTSSTGLMLIPGTAGIAGQWVVRAVFRPIVGRDPDAAVH